MLPLHPAATHVVSSKTFEVHISEDTVVPQLNFGLRASLPIGYLPTKLLSDRPPRAETLPLLVVRLGFDSRYRSFLCLSFPIHLIYRPEKNDSVSILYLPRTVPLNCRSAKTRIRHKKTMPSILPGP